MAWRIRVLADCFPVRGLTITLALADESQGQWKGLRGAGDRGDVEVAAANPLLRMTRTKGQVQIGLDPNTHIAGF